MNSRDFAHNTKLCRNAYSTIYKIRKEWSFVMQHSQGFLHTVQKGDTLYHVPLWAILYANPYINIYNLQIGDEVCIPARVYPKEGMPVDK